jgi:hypothetical protein
MHWSDPKRPVIFVLVLAAVALSINCFLPHRPSFFPTMQSFLQKTDAAPLAGLQKISPPADSYPGFTAEARRVIAAYIAKQDETEFGRMFTLQCVSANQSSRRFNGYNVSANLIVVTARFRLSAVTNNTTGSKWSKDYEVSETVESGQFQGLTSSDTIQRVVGTLKEQVQKDGDFLSVLHKVFNP